MRVRGDRSVVQRHAEREVAEHGAGGPHHDVALGGHAELGRQVAGPEELEGVQTVGREGEPRAGLTVAARPGLEHGDIGTGLRQGQGGCRSGDAASHDESSHLGTLPYKNQMF